MKKHLDYRKETPHILERLSKRGVFYDFQEKRYFRISEWGTQEFLTSLEVQSYKTREGTGFPLMSEINERRGEALKYPHIVLEVDATEAIEAIQEAAKKMEALGKTGEA